MDYQILAVIILFFLAVRLLLPRLIFWPAFLVGRIVRGVKRKIKKKTNATKEVASLTKSTNVEIPLSFDQRHKDVLLDLERPAILRKTNKSFQDLFVR